MWTYIKIRILGRLQRAMNSFQQPGPPQQGWPQNDDINSFKNPVQQSQGWPQPPQQQMPGVLNGNPQNNVKKWHLRLSCQLTE